MTRDTQASAAEARELDVVCTPEGAWSIEWRADDAGATGMDERTRRLQEALARASAAGGDAWLLRLAFADLDTPLAPGLGFLRAFLAGVADAIRHAPEVEAQRQSLSCPLPPERVAAALAAVPPMTGAEYVTTEGLAALWERLVTALRGALAAHTGSVASFVHGLNPAIQLAGRVYFHLVENRAGSAAPFAFLATYSQVDAASGRVRHVPLRHALTEFGTDQKALLNLLGTVHRAAAQSAVARRLLDSGELFHPLAWEAAEAFAFLRDVTCYDACGIVCRIPDWWKTASRGVRLSLAIGDARSAGLGADAILSGKPELVIDGVPISPEEARRLVAESEGLVQIKNRWVAVDPDRLRRVLDAYDKLKAEVAGGLSVRDAIRRQLGGDGADTTDDICPEVTTGQWLTETLRRLSTPATCATVAPAAGFRAQLRPYQQLGLNWLDAMWELGLGACLADDMGLGKTIQLLALLSARRSPAAPTPALLVIPASLLSNWQAEIARFLPGLRVYIFHASAHDGAPELPAGKRLAALDLVITTYGMVTRETRLAETVWQVVVLDEAQAIKNPGTRQTRAVKRLSAGRRIIMTGTPVENRLGDLWSLFDFINPGLLGTAKEFGVFAKSLRDQPQGYARLRQVVAPYILRRLKTDRSVISDLPEKVEVKTFASLSTRQTVLYRELLERLERDLDDADGIARKGVVLGALMRCKQLCNHPDQYLGSGAYDEAESGKFQRLREICETVREKRERMLVFTQFREVAQPLHDFLAGVFERPGLVLHGGVAAAARGALVNRFQGDDYIPFMVLTVKAGGVGLNLTRATHVVHFDRWWNPAVENQATDRAFRIGQRRDVLVHKFIVSGTIEERIDAMLEEKRRLADDVISSGAEAVLTAMGTGDLLKMFRLTL
jgi:superfamily II DNA or RNA helicase